MTASKNAGTRKETKKTKAQVLAERRKQRADLGADRDVMRTPKMPGMVTRWVNDEVKSGRSRVQYLQSLGWIKYDGEAPDVSPPNGVVEANISLGDGAIMAVGIDQEGKSMRAVLMMLPEELYKADQELKEEGIRKTEEGIFDQGEGQGMYGAVRIGT